MGSPYSLAERPGSYRVALKITLEGFDSDYDFSLTLGDYDRVAHKGSWDSSDYWLTELGFGDTGGCKGNNHQLYFFPERYEMGSNAQAAFILYGAPTDPMARGASSGKGRIKNPSNPYWADTVLHWERIVQSSGGSYDDDDEDD